MEKTPEKTEQNTGMENEVTPEKQSTPEAENNKILKTNSTPVKEVLKTECEFKTPEKILQNSVSDQNANKTPEKSTENCDLKSDPVAPSEGDDGMISTTEQARLLIAASKTPSKAMNKTPVKQGTPSGKRSVENSPVTAGKYRRVELITLASPKAKRLKQI